MIPTFFPTPKAFRSWLDEYHQTQQELWVGYYKKASGLASITWPESVDEALCYGWIDGLRKSIDEQRYKIRFTPRRATSIWSATNLRRIKELIAEGRVQPSGLSIYKARNVEKINRYAYERENVQFDPSYEAQLRANSQAAAFFDRLPPSAKKATIWWVMSAKQAATRERRLKVLIESSEAGLRIPHLRRKK